MVESQIQARSKKKKKKKFGRHFKPPITTFSMKQSEPAELREMLMTIFNWILEGEMQHGLGISTSYPKPCRSQRACSFRLILGGAEEAAPFGEHMNGYPHKP